MEVVRNAALDSDHSFGVLVTLGVILLYIVISKTNDPAPKGVYPVGSMCGVHPDKTTGTGTPGLRPMRNLFQNLC